MTLARFRAISSALLFALAVVAFLAAVLTAVAPPEAVAAFQIDSALALQWTP